ncbi:hypothetical protein EDM52_09500 [Brevibacillus invocatus]|uniref:CopC domain-containing protein n=1 Tax=Brevibacillus invocatus TaxID=173959 RepID=A0A3M8CHD8_9BACL|nr:copper resistance protein CopC [Brevibacillus invocatus]RNB74941.1 hypothetical protein EDM52_09500 [Brevibacillus invocatus]
MKRYLVSLWIMLMLVFSLGGMASVQAHAGLMGSTPQEGEVLKTNPGQLSFQFTETLEPDLVSIRLYDWNGIEVRLEQPTLQPGDASRVNVRLPELAQGTYNAIVAVVSEDGHPVEERLSFSIGQKSATVVMPEQRQSDSTYLIVYRHLTQGLLLLGGGMYFVAWRAQRFGLPSFTQVLGMGRQIGWFLMVIGLFFLWFLYDESLPAVSLTTILLQGNWGVLLQSPFAIMLLISLLWLLLLVIPGMVTGWYLFIWALLISTQAFGGHAWGISPVWLSLALRLLHVGTVALWLGALFYLLLTSRQVEQGNPVFKRFFLRMVAIAAILAVLTGALMLAVQTDVGSLLESSMTWNYLLYVKLASFLLMLGIAFRQNRYWRQQNTLQASLLRWELMLGIVAMLAGLWMSHTQYPGT